MLIKLNDSYHTEVQEYLQREPEFNLFIIGDIDRYGYDNYFLNIWGEINADGDIDGILLKYFEFIILSADDDCDLDSFCALIRTLNYSEISGKYEVLRKIAWKLNLTKYRSVHFCKLTNNQYLNLYRGRVPKVKKIRFGNLSKIAKLYEVIEEFENTTIESIKNGLKTGRGYCIEVNRTVVAMAKSTAENDTHAMVVGVGTHPDYRNRGFATNCIIKLCKELVSENKIPCLFYDNKEAGKIYHKLGFEEIGDWIIYYR